MRKWFIFFSLYLFAYKIQAQLYINEIQASNETTIEDNFLEYNDWLEIYNSSNASIDLAGHYLSDDIYQLNKFQIPYTDASATTIPANGHLLFWVDDDEIQGANHCNFKLSSSGETVFLIDPDGTTIIDSITYTSLTSDQTYKRIPDGSSNLQKSAMSSPISTNNSDLGLLEPPVFSIPTGAYPGSQSLTLSNTNGAIIYYTMDGSDPDLNSVIYSSPINIDQNTTIKAMLVKNGFTNSEIKTSVYMIGANHDLPIVNIAIDSMYLFDETLGMYVTGTNGTLGACSVTANWWNDYEYKANVTLIESNGITGFSEDCAIEMSGACSRNGSKKSFNIGFKSAYGKSKLKYKLFNDSDIEEFDGFKLRAGGNGSLSAYNKDALSQKYIEDQLDIDSQYTKPVVLYINGSYWGLYFIRDRMNSGYVDSNYPKYKESAVDMIKFPKADSTNSWHWVRERVMSGSKTAYYDLFDYMENNDLSISANYNYVAEEIDINSLIDYLSVMVFYSKTDWPANNLKVWKANHPSGKWRWLMFDMDFMGSGGAQSINFLNDLLESDIEWGQFHKTSSAMFRNLFENEEFKNEFIQRTNTYISSVWDSTRVEQIANNFNTQFASEIEPNYLRWGGWDANTFLANQNSTTIYINQRPPYWRTMVDSSFNVSGRVDITCSFNGTSNGSVVTNSNFFKIPENHTATYHKNVPIWMHAVPNPGYRFVEWSEINDPSLKNEPSIYTSFNSNQTLTPIFEPALDLVINEIHYNPFGTNEDEEFIELYNPDDKVKPLFGYQFNNGVELTFPKNATINPGEYIIIAKDASIYSGNGYQVFQWECGSLNNDGERVFFSNAAEIVIDSVLYNDNIDWDQNADGLGYSLALIDYIQDNGQPTAWASQATNYEITPGVVNNFCEPINNNPVIADISCSGTNDGFIANQVTGGTEPFNYSWSNGANTSIVNNLQPGTYTLTVSDFYNCPYTETINITEPSVLSASINFTDETLYNANDGNASILVSGGATPYTYNWSNGATTPTVNNLSPGNHSVNVLDANGCDINKSVVIGGISCTPLSVNVTVNNETCVGQSDGLLIAGNFSNGMPPYSILWSTGITGTVANNLTSGSYQLTITDALGCPYQNNYTIEADNIIDVSFNINNVSSSNLTDGSIQTVLPNGAGPYNYSWSTSAINQNLNNVGEGVYSVTVSDTNGCSKFFDQLIVGNSCIPSIVQQNNPIIASQSYKVALFIQSNGMVNANEQVSFKAGNYIELTDSFEVTIDAEFEAMIDGCE